MSTTQELKELLKRVRVSIPDSEFCGVGVIVYSSLENLPVAPLCSSAEIPIDSDLAQQIAICSMGSSRCHDGFHLISETWELTKRNQYFAPFPEVDGLMTTTVNGNFGSRHMAAKLGSLLDSVNCTGLLSDRDGMVVFVDGVSVD